MGRDDEEKMDRPIVGNKSGDMLVIKQSIDEGTEHIYKIREISRVIEEMLVGGRAGVDADPKESPPPPGCLPWIQNIIKDNNKVHVEILDILNRVKIYLS